MAKGVEHPRSVYLRESAVVPVLDEWLAGLFAPERLDETCAALAATTEHDEGSEARAEAARRRLRDCDTRLDRYRAALEGGADPVIVGQWIAEVRVDRHVAEAELTACSRSGRLTTDDVRQLVVYAGDLVEALSAAEPADKAALYANLGLSLTWHPDRRVCAVRVEPGSACSKVRVGGGT